MEEGKKIKFFRGRIKSVDADSKTVKAVISDESKDRYKERVLVTSFEKTKGDFMKHPILLSSHSYHGLKNQIGEFKDLSIDKKKKEVVGEIEYYVGLGNEEADWAWVLAQKGIAAFSIGFIPKQTKYYEDEEREKNGGIRCDYEEIELLETSQVLIPANPAALQKSFEEAEEGESKDFIEEVMKLSSEYEKTKVGPEEVVDSLDNLIGIDRGWEEKPNEIWHSLKEGSYSKTRRFTIKKDKPRVFGLYGKVSGSDKWEIYALRFPKADGWTMEKAKAWAKSHSNIGKDYVEDDVDVISDILNEREYLFETVILDVINDFVDGVMNILSSKKEEKEDGEQKEEAEEDSTHKEAGEEGIKEEELESLRTVLFGNEISEEDSLRKLFEDITKETKERFAVQSIKTMSQAK